MYKLVTTLNEEGARLKSPSYGFDYKTVYLGQWCVESLKCKNQNSEILRYHWDDREKAFADFQYLQNLRVKIFNSITSSLNRVHGIDLSSRAWNLMVGYWLEQFLTVAFDRWEMLSVAEKNFSPIMTEVCNYNWTEYVPNDTQEAGNQFIDDGWNHVFIGELAKRFPKIQINQVKDTQTRLDLEPKNIKKLKIAHSVKSIVRRLIFKVYSNVLALSGREKVDCFYCASQFNVSQLIKLKQLLRANIFVNPEIPKNFTNEYSSLLRGWAVSDIDPKSNFELVVSQIIPQWIPKIFLEGFVTTWQNVRKINPSRMPEFVITQNRHFTDDSFKIWCANKLNNGLKIAVVQHGGGLNKFNGALQYESEIGDIYLVNGCGDQTSKSHRVVGRLWGGMQYGKWDPRGTALMICVAMPRYAYDLRSMAIGGQMGKYFEDQFKFYENTPFDIQDKIRVRLYNVDYKWRQRQRWSHRFPKAQFDDSNRSIALSARRSRVVISTYNASAYLESLSANIPTIIFWDNELWEVPMSAEGDFKSLESVGIFHRSPASAAKQLESVWNDVGVWWFSRELQRVREDFCRKYAFWANNLMPKFAEVIIDSFYQSLKVDRE
jgi:putative transferase (TIGR04331 family)